MLSSLACNLFEILFAFREFRERTQSGMGRKRYEECCRFSQSEFGSQTSPQHVSVLHNSLVHTSHNNQTVTNVKQTTKDSDLEPFFPDSKSNETAQSAKMIQGIFYARFFPTEGTFLLPSSHLTPHSFTNPPPQEPKSTPSHPRAA